MKKRNLTALKMVCTGCLGILIYIINIYSFRQRKRIIDFESKNFNSYIQDYALEFVFTKKQIEFFEKNIYH